MRYICSLAFAVFFAAPAHADSQTRGARAESPIAAVAAANDASRHRPSRESFDAARQVYVYAPGAIYELYANPNFVSAILLEPGETLNSIAAGDTARWMVTHADTETEGQGRTVVLVKPQTGGLRTNIVLITDRRTYLVEANAQTGVAYSAEIAWSYEQSPDSVEETPLDRLNLNYRIRPMGGARPGWTPDRVFDDGRRTWIEFAPAVSAADLPPLFVITGEGLELVNYRVLSGPAGQRYEVDRTFDVAELRLGTRAPVIVRIERNPRPVAPPSRRHRR